MSRFFAIHADTNEVRDIIWRKYPIGHPWREYGWYRVYWGDEEIGRLTRSCSTHWDVSIVVQIPNMAEAHYRGVGFATRWYATEYILKCVGIWKHDVP